MRARFCASAALQHALDHASGQLFQKVHGVVDKHVVHQAHGFVVVHGLDDALALVGVHVGKYVRRDVLGQEPEHHQHFFIVKFLHVLGDVHLVEHGERAAQFALAALGHELVQTRANFFRNPSASPSLRLFRNARKQHTAHGRAVLATFRQMFENDGLPGKVSPRQGGRSDFGERLHWTHI